MEFAPAVFDATAIVPLPWPGYVADQGKWHPTR